MNDFLINEGIPVTLFSSMMTFRDSNKSFKLDGDLLETMINYDFNVSHSNPKDQKLIYEFGKEMNFNIEQKGRKSDRDRSLIKLLKSPAVMASGISNIIILSSDPDETCKRLKLLLQEKQTGDDSNIIIEEIIAIVDKLLEYKCITKKQHKQFLIKCNLLLIYMCTQIKLYVYIFYIKLFKLSEKYEIDRSILKCDYIRYSPSEIN